MLYSLLAIAGTHRPATIPLPTFHQIVQFLSIILLFTSSMSIFCFSSDRVTQYRIHFASEDSMPSLALHSEMSKYGELVYFLKNSSRNPLPWKFSIFYIGYVLLVNIAVYPLIIGMIYLRYFISKLNDNVILKLLVFSIFLVGGISIVSFLSKTFLQALSRILGPLEASWVRQHLKI